MTAYRDRPQVAKAHEALVSAREAIRQQAWVAQRIASATAEREHAATRHEALRLRYEVEKDDVEDLEGSVLATIGRLFSSSKKEDLERERDQAAAFKLQLDEVDGELAAVDAELVKLREREAGMANTSNRLAEATQALEALVRGSDPEFAQQLDGLGEREAALRALLREIGEAMSAAMVVDSGLERIGQSLKGARKLAIGTNVAGSLLYATELDNAAMGAQAISHVNLQRIRTDMGNVRHDLVCFQEECKDIANAPDLDGVQLEAMPGVLEFIVADLMGWHILEVIHDVDWRVEKTQDDVQLAYANLRHRKAAVERLLNEAIEQKATLLAHSAF